MTGIAVVLLLLISSAAVGQTQGGVRARGQNSVADVLHDRGLDLGIDFDSENPKATHLSEDGRRVYGRAGFGAWLNSELERGDDAISEPPAALRDYLRDHHDSIWSIVAALEKGSPDWGERPPGELWANVTLIQTTMLQRVLLATTLCEEREGRTIDAERSLEASWSLNRPLATRLDLISQLISIQIERWQSGVLRRMSVPSLTWMSRLAGEDPWGRMLAAMAGEPRSNAPSGLSDPFSEVYVKARQPIVEGLRKVGPCELAALSEEEVWRFAANALAVESSPEKRWSRDLAQESVTPNLLGALRRASRMSIDRELTLQILRVRLERQASREEAWPAELADSTSVVCPGALYSYRSDSAGMEIRFEGSVDSPSGPSLLPLTFHTGQSRATRTPTPTPTTTPTPEAL